jgi:hypothetical protein
VIATDGTVAATVATATDTQSSYVAFGSPATSAVYIANSGTTIRKLVGTTFSTPAGMPKCKFVAVQAPSNRLVAANVNQIPTGLRRPPRRRWCISPTPWHRRRGAPTTTST